MQRNVLFSFLGTSNYQECIYTYHGRKSQRTRFIQTAIYELVLNECLNLEVVVFVTKEAKKMNWDDGYYHDPLTNIPQKGLKNCLSQNFSVSVKEVDLSGVSRRLVTGIYSTKFMKKYNLEIGSTLISHIVCGRIRSSRWQS